MKKIFLIALFIVGAFASQAQELKWYTDVKEAITVSNKENKPMLMFFTGSDWCGWCIRLQNEVLKTTEFQKWATDNVILVELDYPRRTPQTPEIKSQNNELQQAFGIQGFPTVFFTSAESKDGKINFKGLGQTGYVAGGPSAWLAVAEGIVHPKKS
ncbi:thioredoxin family protein [Flavobacterium sp. ANB]|jgi:thioredoxin-related protein|uniref:thioredoxin family protein n=1 Tax=unclassified Flavobacterium TaxID=196869 RepID=UPI0012B9AB04|nr:MULTISPECIES: thioredoxin family protein [unclassified Flavobacterium]MBF4514926.1 thioredoxin family protein [Flavobacterium sp. ANB]MTD68252.1 thioredoxin fold domain-containing protein [Flavobacterium sp. LC2016-13]